MASFTTQIKEEITKIETERCESLAEASSYIYFNGSITSTSITLYIENNSVARRMFNLIKRLYGVNIKLIIRTQKRFNVKTIYILEITEKVADIRKDIEDSLNNIPVYSNPEKASFLKGAFLSSGSINDPKKSKYHLEILVTFENDAMLIKDLLADLGFTSKVLKRDKGYMVYLKQAEEISDFIKLLGAINALFYFEDIRIYRDHKNMVNRLNNCEIANEVKSLKTCNEQIANINYLKEHDLISILDEKNKLVIEYRLKYPETTLAELAEIISMETDLKITKSGINHHFRKIASLVEKNKKTKESS